MVAVEDFIDVGNILGKSWVSLYWTILTPGRSIGVMSKVILGQGQILGHPIKQPRDYLYYMSYKHVTFDFIDGQ